MDGSRFDTLARSFAVRRSRRGVVGALAGLAAGAVGLRGSGAACPPGTVCPEGACGASDDGCGGTIDCGPCGECAGQADGTPCRGRGVGAALLRRRLPADARLPPDQRLLRGRG